QAAAEFRRRATRFIPAKVKASLTVGGEGQARPASALFKVDGSAGAFKVSLQGQTDAPAESLTLDTLSRLDSAKLNLTGRLDPDDGKALVDLLGLDSLLAVDKRPGRLTLTANGPLNGNVSVDGKLVAGGLDLSPQGNVRLVGGQGPTAGVAIRVAN